MESAYLRILMFVLQICKSYEKQRVTKPFCISAFSCIRFWVAGPSLGFLTFKAQGETPSFNLLDETPLFNLL